MRFTIFYLAVFLLFTTAKADLQRIPLYRRTNSKSVVTTEGHQLDSGVLAGKVTIGTPPREFTMAFDTTTSYSWVRGYRCKSENCRGRRSYYTRRSETAEPAHKKLSVEYGDSCVDTKLYYDDFEVNGIPVGHMPFGVAYRMSGFDDGFDGYLGLGIDGDLSSWDESHKLYAGSSKLLRRASVIASLAFVTNAYVEGSIDSAQFGMVTTSSTSRGFSQSGSSSTPPENDSPSDSNNGNRHSNSTKSKTAPTTTSTVGSGTFATQIATTSTLMGFPTTQPSLSINPTISGGFGFIKRTISEPDGYLIIGGVDKSLIDGDIEYIPLADPVKGSSRNWDVCIRDANFEHALNIRQKENAIAAISTSYGYITMPSDQADQFQTVFGLKYYENTQTYGIKCSEVKYLPTLKLTLENHIVELPPKYWIRVIDAERNCCGTRIRRGHSTRDWILGTPFTNAFYTTFDPASKAIGLGIKKGQEDDGLAVYQKSH
ncbi:aspartic peptidase domain-containing protein [Dichotomocladium elegans]|nr:aspartic peptidase domain-containing protein [Dichotomocladium elegans]